MLWYQLSQETFFYSGTLWCVKPRLTSTPKFSAIFLSISTHKIKNTRHNDLRRKNPSTFSLFLFKEQEYKTGALTWIALNSTLDYKWNPHHSIYRYKAQPTSLVVWATTITQKSPPRSLTISSYLTKKHLNNPTSSTSLDFRIILILSWHLTKIRLL